MARTSTAYIPVRIEPKYRDKLKILAKEDGMTLSTYCRTILIHAVRESEAKKLEKGGQQ